MKLVHNAGQHSYDPPVDGIRHCALCLIAEPLLVGQFQCSGVRGMFGRPVFAQDLTGRDDARLSEASVATATTVNAPTGSPPAAPRPVKKSPRSWVAARAKVDEEGSCRACGGTRQLEAAHIIPRSRVTTNGEDSRNIIPLCVSCHRAQHAGNLELLPLLTLAEQGFIAGLVGIENARRRTTKDAA